MEKSEDIHFGDENQLNLFKTTFNINYSPLMVNCWLNYFFSLWRTSWGLLQRQPRVPWLTVGFRWAVISELEWSIAAANVVHAYHLLLTGINKNLIWGNYEKPTHYAIWFMFWHVAIIGLIAKKPSFPERYGLCFNCRPARAPCFSHVCLIS